MAQNYPAHAAEAGGDSPFEPVMFFKPLSTFLGHQGMVEIPAVTQFLDYEAELAVVLGSELSNGTPEQAERAIYGYTLANDGSARDLQRASLADKEIVDWFSAKALDRCSALGPVIVPKEELGDPSNISLTGKLNGDTVQHDNIGSMHIGIPSLLSYASHRLALRPGDIILTGTPAGVGKARDRNLKDGDVFSVEAPGLGQLTTLYSDV